MPSSNTILPGLRSACLALLLAAVPLSAGGQQAQTLTPRVVSPSPADSILIQPGDTITVTLFDIPELSREVRVSADGSVRLSILGDVPVGNLSESQAAQRIDDAYQSHDVVKFPQASVFINQFASNGVSIIGEVVHPGVYPIGGPRTLFDVLALAGGLTTNADTHIDLRHTDGHMVRGISVPLIRSEAALESNVAIIPGDRILVPRAGTVFVLGQVTKPGGYLMQYDGTITVLQAIAQANGTTRTSGDKNVVLIRRTEGVATIERLSLQAMYKGSRPDISLHAGDVIYVPDSIARSFVVSAPEILGTLAGAAIYSVNR